MGTFRVRKTTEQFIAEAKAVHGDKYDYSKVEYKTSRDKVCIICPVHGEFWQTAFRHLRGEGCPSCPRKRTIGSCDMRGVKHTRCYNIWNGIIIRCYTDRRPSAISYVGCCVCEEWLTFSNFYKWFSNPLNGYQDGYDIDKDVLIKGNKIYSPRTCCFLPPELNKVFIKGKARRGVYPIGVYPLPSGRFASRIQIKGKQVHIGTFDCIEDAFNAYKATKEQYIKELAESYFKEGKITERVYQALMKYEVEITD